MDCFNFNEISLAPGQSRTIECYDVELASNTKLGSEAPIRFYYLDSIGALYNQDYGNFIFKIWVCGDKIYDSDGNEYNTIKIGTQCWMKENLNFGTMVIGILDPENDIVEKWCYNDDIENCNLYGGLYSWNEAMQGSVLSGSRGICPRGWHIPTNLEYNILELYVLSVINSLNPQFPCDLALSEWARCADDNGSPNGGINGAGKSLRKQGTGSGMYLGNDLVNFTALMGGLKQSDNTYWGINIRFFYWSSDLFNENNGIYRTIATTRSTIALRQGNINSNGMSIRCIKS